jgi:hypothetical protein
MKLLRVVPEIGRDNQYNLSIRDSAALRGTHCKFRLEESFKIRDCCYRAQTDGSVVERVHCDVWVRRGRTAFHYVGGCHATGIKHGSSSVAAAGPLSMSGRGDSEQHEHDGKAGEFFQYQLLVPVRPIYHILLCNAQWIGKFAMQRYIVIKVRLPLPLGPLVEEHPERKLTISTKPDEFSSEDSAFEYAASLVQEGYGLRIEETPNGRVWTHAEILRRLNGNGP